jgi:small subunit ribosomal protein S6
VRDYELVLVISPEVGDEGLPVTLERIQGQIQANGGEVKQVDQWGRRRLAYPIRRALEGYYVITKVALEPQAVRPIEASLDLAEDVLRHLIVKLEEVPQQAGSA